MEITPIGGSRLNKSSDNTFSGVESADFIQYGYSNGGSISGSGSGILNGYDPELTKPTAMYQEPQ